MSTKINLTYFGMEGSGATVTEAKKDAGRKIEAALDGSYTPEIVAWRGYAALVYREPTGWYTRLIICPDEKGIRDGKVWGSNAGMYKEAMIQAQSHVADLGWERADGETPPAFLKDRDAIANYVYQARFRERYYQAIDRGMSKDDAHCYAGGSLGRPDLVKLMEVAS
jgi:hypothetical protein